MEISYITKLLIYLIMKFYDTNWVVPKTDSIFPSSAHVPLTNQQEMHDLIVWHILDKSLVYPIFH